MEKTKSSLFFSSQSALILGITIAIGLPVVSEKPILSLLKELNTLLHDTVFSLNAIALVYAPITLFIVTNKVLNGAPLSKTYFRYSAPLFLLLIFKFVSNWIHSS